MARQRSTTKEQEEQIIREYKAGISTSTLSVNYGVHSITIIRVLGDLYIKKRPGIKKKQEYKKKDEYSLAHQSRKLTQGFDYKKYINERFEAIQVGQEVRYKSKTATVIQKTDNLVVLKVHKKHREAILSLNKADIGKGLIA